MQKVRGGRRDVHREEGWGTVRCVVVMAVQKDGGRSVGVEMCGCTWLWVCRRMGIEGVLVWTTQKDGGGCVSVREGGRDEDCNTESRLKFQMAVFSHMGTMFELEIFQQLQNALKSSLSLLCS